MTPKQLDFFYKTTIIRMLLPNPDLLHCILQHIMAMKILQHCYFKGMLMLTMQQRYVNSGNGFISIDELFLAL